MTAAGRATRGWLAVVVLGAALGGCAGNLMKSVEDALPQKEPEYKSSKAVAPLEVPPDLSSAQLGDAMQIPPVGGGSATYSQYASAAPAPGTVVATTTVLPPVTEARVERHGDKRWLVVDAAPGYVWPKSRDFWLTQGFIVEMEDPSIGIMETDWAEKREAFRSGIMSQLMQKLSSALYGAAIRDKFRTRLERGQQPGTTEVYITHRGAEEVKNTINNREGEEYRVWQPRPSDPELEAEMLNRFMVFLGIDEERVETLMARAEEDRPERAHMVRGDDGASALALDEDFSRAWRRTGLALDRVGFTVEDRDRSRGLYFVRYVDPDKDSGNKEGFLSKMKFWGDDEKPKNIEYLISLEGQDERTQVIVLDKEGQRENSATADRILGLLHEQLK